MTSAAQELLSSIPREEVTVASSLAGAPRLDFPSFCSIALDDADKSALPRAKSSSDFVCEAMRRADDNDDDGSLDGRQTRARARHEGHRASMSHLIQFLQTVPPPPQNYLTSAFDDDETETTEGPGKWKQLRNKLRLRIQRPDSAVSDEAPQPKLKLPGAAVVAKTTRGHSHIAISVPMEHCHLGPDSDWSAAAFNATKPLPPSPPVEPRDHVVKSAAHDDNDRHARREGPNRRAREPPRMPRLRTKDSNASIRLWSPPISPPQSPPTTASSARNSHSSRPATSSTTHTPRIPLPADPNDYVEVSRSTTLAPKTPECIVEERIRQVHVSWLTTTHLLESAGGPPPPPPPQNSPPTKPLPSPSSRFSTNRPQHLRLPVRKSSLKARPGLASPPGEPSTQPPLESPRQMSERCGISSVGASGPVKPPARGATGETVVVSPSAPPAPFENAIPDSPLLLPAVRYISPPLSGHAMHTSDTANAADATATEMTDEPDTAESTTPARKPSTRLNEARKSRIQKVKSLKQRDMEAARRQLRQLKHSPGVEGDDLPQEPRRPRTAETAISSLRLPSREGRPCAEMADEFPRPPTADQDDVESTPDACLYSDAASRPASVMTSAAEGDEHPDETLDSTSYAQQVGRQSHLLKPDSARPSVPEDASSARTSTISSIPSLRFNSFTRTSWASSIPLLERFGSYEPSEASFVEAAEPSESPETPRRRSDSATLPRMEQERLVPSRFSFLASPPEQQDSDEAVESCDTDEASVEISSSAPRPHQTLRMSAIMPAVDIQPEASPEYLWPATSGLAPSTSSVSGQSPASKLVTSKPTPPQAPFGFFPPGRCSVTADEVPVSEVRRRPSSKHTRQLSGLDKQSLAQDVFRSRACVARSDSDFLSRFDQFLSRHNKPYGLRLSSEPRAADLAQHILLNQKRLELDLRRQEHKQMIFLSQLERTLEEIKRTIPPQGPFRESFGWGDSDATAMSHPTQAMPGKRRISHRRGLAGSDPTCPTGVLSGERNCHSQSQSLGPRRLWLVDGIGDDYGGSSR